MTSCQSCGNVLIRECDEEGTPTNHWYDKGGNIYCDQCFYELYTVPEEKTIDDLESNWKSIREKAKIKIKEFEAFWGIKSI